MLADLVNFLEAEEEGDLLRGVDKDKSPDLLLSICLIPSATRTAGFDLKLPQNDM